STSPSASKAPRSNAGGQGPMPDRVLILQAMAGAALAAAALLLLAGWPWRAPRPWRTSVGGVLGVGLGVYLGFWWVGRQAHWPPREDQDRLVFLLFPAAVGVELVGAFPGRLRWLAWALRLAVAAGAGWVLLYNSSYITDLAGPGSREWTPAQTW